MVRKTMGPLAGKIPWASALLACGILLVLAIAILVEERSTRECREGQALILVIIDTCRRDSLGCWGSPRETTPNIDAWARDAVRFDTATAESCWTLPSVASILTSTFPTLHGGSGKGLKLQRIREELPTGPEILREKGLTTHAVINCAFLSPALGVGRGFCTYDYEGAYNNRIRRADQTVDAALEVLRKHPGGDIFLLIHFFDPHLNYEPPSPYDERFTGGYAGPFRTIDQKLLDDLMHGNLIPGEPERNYLRSLYDGEIAFVDEQFSRLAAGIRALGFYPKATLVLTSDHGEEFWDHGGFEHGHSLYDELIRVPLIIKFPEDIVPARRVVKSPVRLIDVMPTLFEIAGVAEPETFEGDSLLPYVTELEEPAGRPSFSEGTLYGTDKLSLRKGEYKYILDLQGGKEVLFHWQRDPEERDNLAEAFPEKSRGMKEELLKIHRSLLKRAQKLSPPKAVDMTEDLEARLKSLGYLR